MKILSAPVLALVVACWVNAAAAQLPSTTIKRCGDVAPSMPAEAERALAATVVVRTAKGKGSGFIISPDGYILTAAHVASEDHVQVRLRSEAIHEARVMRLDENADVALLRLEEPPENLACLTMATDVAKVGEDIYVLGNPTGDSLAFSVSRGIISAVRELREMPFLQTDAAINPGNSGGPLVGNDGRVQAIASWKRPGGRWRGWGSLFQWASRCLP